MNHDTRLRKLEDHVSPPLGVGSWLDEPCSECGSSPVRFDIPLLDRVTGAAYPAPVGLVGCPICHLRSWSRATMEVGKQEGWFEPGGWVYELYAEHPPTDEVRAYWQREADEARAAPRAAGRGEEP